MRFFVVLALLLTACGSKPRASEMPDVISKPLIAQMHRIESRLAWTCGGGAPARSVNFPCVAEGDTVSAVGRILLDGNIGEWNIILNSIDADGRPWRNPDLVGSDDPNSFSRDQMLGLLEGSLARRDFAGLRNVMRYVQEKGNLCPGDDRCHVTASIRLLARQILGDAIGTSERAADEATLRAEALTAPQGYRAYLVARKLMLHLRTNHNSKSYAKTAALLEKRFPKMLFIRTVSKMANAGTPVQFEAIARDLTACMVTWSGPGLAWWSEEAFDGCAEKSYGHEMVALGQLLLGLHFPDGVVSLVQ